MTSIGYRMALVACMALVPWAVSRGQGAGQPINGISCDAQEGQRIHIHQHLVILDHGKPVTVPADVGRPALLQCLYWLHTHTPDGFIHIEAPKERSFSLGDFFAVWGQPLSATKVATATATKAQPLKVWVNGKEYAGDPKTIKLDVHTDIVIQVGPPYAKPPLFTAWGSL